MHKGQADERTEKLGKPGSRIEEQRRKDVCGKKKEDSEFLERKKQIKAEQYRGDTLKRSGSLPDVNQKGAIKQYFRKISASEAEAATSAKAEKRKERGNPEEREIKRANTEIDTEESEEEEEEEKASEVTELNETVIQKSNFWKRTRR